ncbi:agrin-like isoform X1 [Haliotis rufescens]|uniref:agrin-like isoform X1 n=1 Tax=Haliotis rufescens TaxID=6454 RepID=UPI00201F3AE5|nr:agrin-like isoform X1 [Haliotis rufescens]
MHFILLEVLLLVCIGEYAETVGIAGCGIVDQLACDDFEERRVCGSDGRDYFNDCDFAKAHCHDPSLHVGYVGECPTTTLARTTTATTTSPTTHPANANLLCKALQAAQCPDDSEELCGTDRNTYPNLCKFQQAKCSSPRLEIDHVGVCVTPSPLCEAFSIAICENTRREMCGSDKITYYNLCYFQKALCLNPSLSVLHEGSCNGVHATDPAITPPPKTTTPTTTVRQGPTLSPVCQALLLAVCGSHVEAMCGSNGNTYPNPCQLKKHECLDPSITLAYVGHCSTSTTSTTSTTTVIPSTTTVNPLTTTMPLPSTTPVPTAQESTTSLPMTSGPTEQGSTTPIPVTSQPTAHVSTTPLPVTSRLTTQGSTTPLPVTSRPTTQESTTQLPVTSQPTPQESTTQGPTGPVLTVSALDIICRAIMHFNCPSTPEPICGSDGKTYPNECEFEKAKCTHRNLHAASFGPCNK